MLTLRGVLLYALGLALTVLSGALSPIPGYVLILAVCLSLGLGLGALVRDPSGLRDHRQ
jgi:hypothetical protein